jgi:hypothetical protein
MAMSSVLVASRGPVRHRMSLAATFAMATSLVLELSSMSSAAASDSWTAVTIGQSSWGAATARTISEAIALAIRDCRSRSTRSADCGAEIKTIRTGHVIAVRCGVYRALVAGDTEDYAEFALANRLLQLRYVSNARLGPCARVLELRAPLSPFVPSAGVDIAHAAR